MSPPSRCRSPLERTYYANLAKSAARARYSVSSCSGLPKIARWSHCVCLRVLGAQRAAELWAQAKGSPFWLAILAGGGGEHDLAGHIAARLRGLGRDANRILALLAVATRPLATSELEAIIGWEHSRTEASLAELERSGLMVIQGVAVSLAHDLIRVSAMSQMPAPARRELITKLPPF